jgi:hypothetical protein
MSDAQRRYVVLAQFAGLALVFAGFLFADNGLSLGLFIAGGAMTAVSGTLLARAAWGELLSDSKNRNRIPLYLWIAGFLVGIVAIWIGGGEDIPALQILLLPSGLLIAAGGILLARDFGGSVDWMMSFFWEQQFGRVPLLQGRVGRFQMRGIGVVAAVIGLGWAAGGVYVFVDRIA